mmetsp:Transcript_4188/g.11687  ORF Transcript_4188/g.11687 Transcript_4188/m.11687 type:complete len:280 (+) Transcript_4188:107-946(+)
MAEHRSDFDNMAIGFAAAPAFTVSLQPTIYLKHARMQGMPLTACPRILWRGTMASIYNETGQCGLQFLTAGVFKRFLQGDSRRSLTPLEDMSAAAAAGAASALYVSPVELVMIQQQNFGGTLAHTCARMHRSFGMYGFTRGYVATALRDAVYVVGMLSATPLLEQRMSQAGLGATAGSMLGSCAAGIVAGALSCPFDCIKACMKGDMERRRYNGFLDTGRHLWRTGGPSRLLHGVEWRCANLSGCFFIVSAATRAWDSVGGFGALERLGIFGAAMPNMA